MALDPIVAASVWFGLSVMALVVACWFAIEGCLYLVKRPPITYYVRTWRSHHMVMAAAIAAGSVAAVAVAFTHFVLDGGSH
jgi:hypothetical protein